MDLFHGFFSAFAFLFRNDQRRYLLDVIDLQEDYFSEGDAFFASTIDVDFVNVVFPAFSFLLRQNQRLDQLDLLDEPFELIEHGDISGFEANFNEIFIDHNNNVVVFQINNNRFIQ
ncbi:hypothetical protein QR680_016870 [Steinernema hermaphroditum]|uniref:Uncharacterized protein n=1 Tax=Steinernema hermaphroditum TaxID=289476 RepID=A0AA39HCJ0_9BILA|nr:hypothetical protein QR680_016870 [Steinernema hermaphroditum]